MLKKIGVVASIILALVLGGGPPPPPDLPSSAAPGVTITASLEQAVREAQEHEHTPTHDLGPVPPAEITATMSQVNASAEALIRGAVPHSAAPSVGGELFTLCVLGCVVWLAGLARGGPLVVAPGRP